MFAGKGMATSCVKAHGYRATHVDIKDAKLYDVAERGSIFDILSASGFPTLNSTHAFARKLLHKTRAQCWGLRLVVMSILQADPQGFVVWLGVLCATWSIASRGTT